MTDERVQTRRDFLSGVAMGSGLLLAGCHRAGETGETAVLGGPADVTLRIGLALVDIAKDHTISTIGYNGQVPGPLIRLREGVAATVDLFNDTDSPELVHWHGFIIPTDVDGAEEERSLAGPGPWPPALPAHAPAIRRTVRAHSCHAHVRPEPGHLLRAVRVRVHRAEEQSGAVRSGNLSGHA
jgi:Multicopper oxidase